MDSRRRGRPRAYDADAALARARDTFWDQGFAATSLDELSAATGMNRPSLYGAFGDKQALYLTVFDRYRAAAREAMARALAPDRPLREGLGRVYQAALSLYLSGEAGGRGCFMIGTGAAEAVTRPEVRAALADGLHELDAGLEARLRRAVETGELPAAADPAALAWMAAALLHTLAIRARAGETRAQLEAIVAAGLDLICGKA